LGLPSSWPHNSSTMRNYETLHLPLETKWWRVSIYECVTCIYIVLHVLIPQTNSCLIHASWPHLWFSCRLLQSIFLWGPCLKLHHMGTILDTSSNRPTAFRGFQTCFRASSRVDINENQFSNKVVELASHILKDAMYTTPVHSFLDFNNICFCNVIP